MTRLIIPKRRLWVVESSGGPRSGKGTCTKYLGENYRSASTDETGADYRAITLGLIEDGRLDPEMSDVQIKTRIRKLSQGLLTDYAARRYELVATHGEKALYTSTVNRTVGKVSPHPNVRTAVKDGFQKRVEGVIEEGNTSLLIVDGRNLQPVIKKVPGAEFLLRMFIDCSLPVAVLREASREEVNLATPEGNEWFMNTWDDIADRRRRDELREDDPAIKDSNAINYWFKNDSLLQTISMEAQRNHLPIGIAAQRVTSPRGTHVNGREGVGAVAYREGRQVYLDTSDIGLDAMKIISHTLVREAYEEAT